MINVEKHKLKKGGEFGGEDIVHVLLRIQKNKELEFPITNENIKAVIFVSRSFIFLSVAE